MGEKTKPVVWNVQLPYSKYFGQDQDVEYTSHVSKSNLNLVFISFRPLECSVEQEVDPEKCDTWGLGMISLELFTGGMYRIKSFDPEWRPENSEELIRKLLQRSPFMGYVEGTYNLITMFQIARYRASTCLEFQWDTDVQGFNFQFRLVNEYPYRNYYVNHENFLSDIRSFVYRLLVFSPRRRMTLQRAFEQPLISNRKPQERK